MRDPVDPQTGEIDYDAAIQLDAEDLAEAGLRSSYEEDVTPALIELGIHPATVRESIDEASGRYDVQAQGVRYPITGPDIKAIDFWGNATFALFDIVNRQLEHLEIKFYALYGGNDLHGIVMTPDAAERAKRPLHRKQDWPYIATPEPEWNGAYHD
jgi:hypothetical protein